MERDAWAACLQLRELEKQIAIQRKFVADLKAQELDAEGEGERLTELLSQLDRLLRENVSIAA
jgi:hypothetical protein